MQLTKTELEHMYYSMTNRELANKLGITVGYVHQLVEKHGIKTKGKSFKPGRRFVVLEG